MLELPDGYDEVIASGGRRGKPAINLLFDHWERTMGYPITVKKTENRRFAELLLRREAPDRILEYIILAWAARTDRYAPRISSFTELYYKWDKLTEWAMRKQTKTSDVINLD